MSEKFKFSVVIPVYNVEDYLREAIDSIVSQNIGFEKNIQIILINDGSQDDSEAICLEYKEKYPNNIVYLKQENSGVSAARNKGMEYIQGEIVNFIDSDDKWELDSFKRVYQFFKKYKQVDVATATIEFFEAKTGGHILNYRMNEGQRVADLTKEEEYNSIVVQVATSFFRASAIEDVRFKEGLKFGEDSLFVNTVVLKKMLLGFIPKAKYYYRKRESGTSAVQISKYQPDFFDETLDNYHFALMELSRKNQGSVVPYIQYVIYYDLAWRFRIDLGETLNEQQRKKFLDKSHQIMQEIDDEVILRNPVHRNFVHKGIAYKVKHGHKLTDDIELTEEAELAVGDQLLLTLPKSFGMCRVNFIDIKNKCFHMEGTVSKWLFELSRLSPQFVIAVGKKIYQPDIWENTNAGVMTMDGRVHHSYCFSVNIPMKIFKLGKIGRVRSALILNGKKYNIGMSYSKFVPNWNTSKGIFKNHGNLIYLPKKKVVMVYRLNRSFWTKLKYIWKHQRWLRKNKFGKIANYRIHYFFHRRFHKPQKDIWLLSDRVMNAGDNGEVFFKYLNSIDIPGVQPVFAISKDAECAGRLQKEGKVVFFDTKEYLDTFLDAKKIISSGASEFTLNPFGRDRAHVQDLFHYKFYYLQHGVACADLSSWLNRDAKNIEMIFTVSKRERASFINDAYRYKENNVALTGQARFDELYDKKEKNILILPTWRKSIKQSYDSNTTSVYFDGFVDTEYFQFYNGLMNHPRLLEKMRSLGYKGTFCLHPIHKEQWIDFQGNDVFTVNEGYVDYNKVFAQAALTVTDYSSVIFDFAYLRKYIIYAQFDKEQFFADQTYDEGYFSYEKDGFGPVCYDLEAAVDALIEALEQNCKVPEMYIDRINSFFDFDDKKNSERIYQAIVAHDKKSPVIPEISVRLDLQQAWNKGDMESDTTEDKDLYDNEENDGEEEEGDDNLEEEEID